MSRDRAVKLNFRARREKVGFQLFLSIKFGYKSCYFFVTKTDGFGQNIRQLNR